MEEKKYKYQFCSKHFESVDGLACHTKAKHEGKSVVDSKIKNQADKPVSKLILFAWILSIIQIIVMIRLFFSIYKAKNLLSNPEIPIEWGIVIILVFIIGFLTYYMLLRQLGSQHKAQIKSCTIYAALFIFTIFGIIGIGFSKGVYLVRGIIPGYSEWVNSEITTQGTHPTNSFKDIKKVKGLQPMGLSLMSYALIIPFYIIIGTINTLLNLHINFNLW